MVELLVAPPDPLQVRTYVYEPMALGVTTCVPDEERLPLHAFVPEQVVAFDDDHDNDALWPRVMLTGFKEIVTVGSVTSGGALCVTRSETDAVVDPTGPMQVRSY